MNKAKVLLKIGLAFTLLYASVSSLTSPKDWIWYIPDWMKLIAPADLLLVLHSSFELVLGVWLLSGWKGFYAATITALDLLVITLVNIQVFGVVFRDVGLFFSAAALIVLYSTKSKYS